MATTAFPCPNCSTLIADEPRRHEEQDGLVHHFWTCPSCERAYGADCSGTPIFEGDEVEAAVTGEGVEAGTFIGRVLIAGSILTEGGPLVNGEEGGFWPPAHLRVIRRQ